VRLAKEPRDGLPVNTPVLSHSLVYIDAFQCGSVFMVTRVVPLRFGGEEEVKLSGGSDSRNEVPRKDVHR
jgi:hypothetical protein